MDLITPEFGLVFWTAIMFLLLLGILRKFAWKPILGAVSDREEGIKKALEALGWSHDPALTAALARGGELEGALQAYVTACYDQDIALGPITGDAEALLAALGVGKT